MRIPISGLLAIALLLGFPRAVRAGERPQPTAISALDAPRMQADQEATAAILPLVTLHGAGDAVRQANAFLSRLLAGRHLDIRFAPRISPPWYRDLENEELDAGAGLPDARWLLALGTALGVDWVVTGRAVWNDVPACLGPGPLRGSICTVDLLIGDVRRQRLALESRQVRMDSRAEASDLRALEPLFAGELPPVVQEDTRSAHEQRAVQLALAKAIQPWLKAHLPSGQEGDTRPRGAGRRAVTASPPAWIDSLRVPAIQ